MAEGKTIRMFPLQVHWKQKNCLREVPWAFIEPHEKQALLNHDQTLERLAQRGGLSIREALAVVQDRKWRDTLHLAEESAHGMLKFELERWYAELRALALPRESEKEFLEGVIVSGISADTWVLQCGVDYYAPSALVDRSKFMGKKVRITIEEIE